MTDRLPVEAVIPELRSALERHGSAVLVAAPGAGKTTIVPGRLLDEPWLAGRRIVMLEPRRVAARAAAARIAWHRGEPVGRTAGYRVRFDSKVSRETRIEVVTEGILIRMLQDDPALESYGLVILDEFHERSIQADLGLALSLLSKAVLRADLRILVMSATIDSARVAAALGGAPVIDAPGRVFPVTTRHRPPRAGQSIEAATAAAIREVLATDPGDVLVFLPGVGEIRRVEAMLADPPVGAAVLPLFGDMAPEAQDAVLGSSEARRVILATAIAETSLTVPGVRIVVDAGLMRVPRFSPRTGMTRLETVRVTRASADQRRGRAGRMEPGVCVRLWSAGEEAGFLAHGTPEILTADLAPLALELAAAGVGDATDLTWLDPPPGSALLQAADLLRQLDALDPRGRITTTGREMVRLGLHPRLGHLAVRAEAEGAQGLAAAIVALVSDRDIARRPAPDRAPDADLRLRIDALLRAGSTPGFEVDRGGLARAGQALREWRRRLNAPAGPVDGDMAGRLLAWAYPDRIAARRPGLPGRFLLRNGRGAVLAAGQSLVRADYLAVAEVDDAGAESRIQLAAPIDAATVAELAEDHGVRETVVEWDPDRRAAVARERLSLGAIRLVERAARDPDPALLQDAAIAAVRREGLGLLDWDEASIRIRQRLAFVHRLDPSRWADVSDAALVADLDSWLRPGLAGGSVRAVDPGRLLLAWIGRERQRALEREAPDRFTVPTGSSLAIDYTDPAAPALPVRLQEMFGVTETPRVGGGRVPLAVQLLSPAGRPVQVTRDLAGFWKTSYFDVKRELKGRYPKHEWPDDPLAASPTRRAKRRGGGSA